MYPNQNPGLNYAYYIVCQLTSEGSNSGLQKRNSSPMFADDMSTVTREGGNVNIGPAIQGNFPNDGTQGFVKFEHTNDLYNVYDAGNFMTGKAFSMIGLSEGKILGGADLNSRITLNGADTKADQRAISNGVNYPWVKWSN